MQNSANSYNRSAVRVLTVLPSPVDRPRPHVYGHRGAPGSVPENTLGSYALAAAMGVEAVAALGVGWVYDNAGARVLLVVPVLVALVPATALAGTPPATWPVRASARSALMSPPGLGRSSSARPK